MSLAYDLERARHEVVKSALRVAYNEWNNSWDSADDVASADFANDLLDDALSRYVTVAVKVRDVAEAPYHCADMQPPKY